MRNFLSPLREHTDPPQAEENNKLDPRRHARGGSGGRGGGRDVLDVRGASVPEFDGGPEASGDRSLHFEHEHHVVQPPGVQGSHVAFCGFRTNKNICCPPACPTTACATLFSTPCSMPRPGKVGPIAPHLGCLDGGRPVSWRAVTAMAADAPLQGRRQGRRRLGSHPPLLESPRVPRRDWMTGSPHPDMSLLLPSPSAHAPAPTARRGRQHGRSGAGCGL